MATYEDTADFITHELFNETLQAYWPLDELNGIRYDLTNNHNNLAETTFTVDHESGILGQSAHFVVDDSSYLRILDNVSLRGGNQDFTVGCWFYLDDNALTGHLIGKVQASNSTIEYQITYVASEGIYFRVAGATLPYVVTILEVLGTNDWNFVVAWNDATNKTINVQLNNGTVSSFNYLTDTLATTVGNFSIGGTDLGSGPDQLFAGRIDEAFKFNKILTTAERSQLYNNGLADRPFKFLEFNSQCVIAANTSFNLLHEIGFQSSDYIGYPNLELIENSNIELGNTQTHNVSLNFQSNNTLFINSETPYSWFIKNKAFKKVMKCGEDGIYKLSK